MKVSRLRLRRVLVAGLFHETHTFLPGRTTLAEFEERWGDELWSAENDGSPLAGALDIARQRNWEVIPAIDLRAPPGPTAEDRVVKRFWSAVESALLREAPGGLEGIYLVLHGAMVSESLPDVEGEILERIRLIVGTEVPVCGVLDLHANVTARMAANSHALLAYREHPHTDACAVARDAALLLDRLMTTGERPVTVWRHPPVMWPPTGTGTAFDPMRTLEKMARHIEETHPEILAVNVFAGFSFADTPDTGVGFTAVTLGNPERALAEVKRLADWTVRNRHLGNVLEEPLDKVLDRISFPPRCNEESDEGPHQNRGGAASGQLKGQASNRRQFGKTTGPIVLAEPSDNIGGGAPGDGIGLLKALIEHRVENAAVAICDSESVQRASQAQPGSRLVLDIGGRGSTLGGAPLRLQVELISTSDGRFTLEDPQSHLASMSGNRHEMGRCAVVRYEGVLILLTSRKTPPFDLGQWRSQGIAPEHLSVIGVKAAVAHRKAYDPIARAHDTVATPGPCPSNLKLLPYRRVRRKIYPLDE